MNNIIATKSINTMRTLTIDAVERAQSGHMGMPLGAAPMAYVLWKYHLKINPNHSSWFNRDRFILSAGHGSMLLYSLLHLSGFKVELEDLKKFREFKSLTPGHPEFKHTDGIDASTGPLGQGVAMAVGNAIAEKKLSNYFNRDSYNMIDHFTFSICGDGDLMEGVSNEAISIAGHLRLNKLIVLYDSNDSSLDGSLDMSFSDDIKMNFETKRWEYLLVDDGNDINKINEAIYQAKKSDKPTLIEVKSIIGYGLPEIEGSYKSHSDPVGEENVNEAKRQLNWEYDESFTVPNEVYDDFKSIAKNGQDQEREWINMLNSYKEDHVDLYEELIRITNSELPIEWDKDLPQYNDISELVATREASHKVLNNLSDKFTELIGGSADLSSSTKATIDNKNRIQWYDFSGKNIYFGVREFGMAAIANGMALHNLRPFVSTYFVFSDYMKPAVRLSALMGLPVIYIYSHDSIAVGKDGPSHQPVEQLAAFRAMPNLNVIRPADGNETVAAWKVAINETERPTMLVLGRQKISIIENTNELANEGVEKGAYILSESKVAISGILIATGSEVSLAVEAKHRLEEEKIFVNVVSMPSWELFERQTKEYKESILPHDIRNRVAIEMASKTGWGNYVGLDGIIISVDDFGISGAPQDVMEEFGFNVDNIVAQFKNNI